MLKVQAAQLVTILIGPFYILTEAFAIVREFPASGKWRTLLLKSTLAESGRNNRRATPDSSALDCDWPRDGIRLWLDLRGTAIPPSSALSVLCDDLCEEANVSRGGRGAVVSGVFVSERNVGRALLRDDCDWSRLGIFYIDKDDGTVRRTNDPSDVAGVYVSLKSGEMINPIPAMCSVSKGGWAVVDSDGIEDDDERGDAVAALVELLSAGASNGSGLMIGGEGLSNQGGGGSCTSFDSDRGTVGGVILCCRSNSDLLRSGAIMQSFEFGGSFRTTDSGLIVKSSDEGCGPVVMGASVEIAVSVPFDIDLWQTAALVFGDLIDC